MVCAHLHLAYLKCYELCRLSSIMYNITFLIYYLMLWPWIWQSLHLVILLWLLWQSYVMSYYSSFTKSKREERDGRIKIKNKKDLNKRRKIKRNKSTIFDSDIIKTVNSTLSSLIRQEFCEDYKWTVVTMLYIKFTHSEDMFLW